MKRILAALAAALLCVLLLAACGGGSHHTLRHRGATGVTQILTTPGGVAFRSPTFGLPPKGLALTLPSAVPFVLGADAVTPGNIPGSYRYIGCYASGTYANCGAMHALHPNATLITIATYAGAAARCLDIEPSDAVPSQGPGWIRWMISLHVYKPCLYSSLSEMSQVIYYLNASGIPRSDYLLWDAHWTGVYRIDGGFDATQWFSDNTIDKDAFATYFFAPAPPPKPVGPSRQQIAAWTKARDSALRSYKQAHCTQPVLSSGSETRKKPRFNTDTFCHAQAGLVVGNQVKLDAAVRRPVCWGPHAQLSAPVCQIVRPELSIYSHARQSSYKVARAKGCYGPSGQSPLNTPGCRKLFGRARYFDRKAQALFKAWA